METDTSRR